METLTVAVAQAPVRPGDVNANATAALGLLEEATAAGARLVVFPELFLSGYDLPGIAAQPQTYAVGLESDVVQRIGAACRRLAVAAVVGACLREPAGLSNAALIFDGAGRVRAVYRKLQLWKNERDIFQPGDRYLLVELFGFRVGVIICYDAGFPEHIRALVRAGAEIIACPAAFARGEERHRFRLYFPQRALENTVYVAVANASGPQGGMEMFGESTIFDPTGRPLASLQENRGVARATVDRRRLVEIREVLPYLAELRTDVPPVLLRP